MSEYTTIEVKIRDPKALGQALKELGYEYESHDVPQSLYGYQGDERKEKANIIVRQKYVGSGSNDVGFVRESDGNYTMIISKYDRSNAKSKSNFIDKLPQIYSKHAILRQVKSMGYTVRSKKSIDGKIKINVTGR